MVFGCSEVPTRVPALGRSGWGIPSLPAPHRVACLVSVGISNFWGGITGWVQGRGVWVGGIATMVFGFFSPLPLPPLPFLLRVWGGRGIFWGGALGGLRVGVF